MRDGRVECIWHLSQWGKKLFTCLADSSRWLVSDFTGECFVWYWKFSAWLNLLEAILVHYGEIESSVLRRVPPGVAIMCGILNRS